MLTIRNRVWKTVVAVGIAGCVVWLSVPGQVGAQGKAFTATDLAPFNGQNGQPAYYAYEGVVYDVTGSSLWENGQHYGLQAGQDLTGQLVGAPHGTEVFAGLPVMGTYVAGEGAMASAVPVASAQPTVQAIPAEVASQTDQPWYASRIRLMGFSILGWTGILMGVFFVLTFATCFAMPWAKLPLPWKGSKIGPDPLDASNKHLTWSSIHKYFVWFAVILGLVHGILGFLQMFFGLYL